ncbi:hypothetical protein SAMN04490186_4552 [Pseudomonas grimontii]|uniref:Carbohydrate binding domain-containing protein n=1 Tax=Pseudomonas grimontii TaxID=129847 RepID=A0A1H1HNK5_9PSED|nr:hypothetical protein [Pseudomonas grimontii]TWR59578.1 hypothetical protein FIV39_27825 [Pseudomonas grimontii]SDR26728.1 hypothetical protein SAMN04490186_4552 [Pseudomonas grimontii]
MSAPRALTSNMILNGSFTDNGKYWDTVGNVDYAGQSCRVITGQASQVINIIPLTSYTLRLWTQVLFKGRGELLIRPNPPATDERIVLDSFHVWTQQQIDYTPPVNTQFITVAVIGNAGEVHADEMHLSSNGTAPGHPELIRNGDFTERLSFWDTSASPIGSRAHFDGETLEAAVGGQARQNVSVTASQTYEFSVRSRSDFSGTGRVVFQLQPIGVLPEITLTTSNWTVHSRELIMPAGTTGCGVILIGETGATYFDDVSLKLKV